MCVMKVSKQKSPFFLTPHPPRVIHVIYGCPLIDAHCEATIGWLEPLAQKIKDNPKTIVIPSIDGIDDRSIAFHGSVVRYYAYLPKVHCI